MTYNHAMLRGENSADFCRRMGWAAGTRIAGDEGYGVTVIEITAIGETSLLARTVQHDGKPRDDGEGLWHLGCRDWARTPDDCYWGA